MRAAPFIVCALIVVAGCAAPRATLKPGQPRQVLKVALYPYLPDVAKDGFQALRDSLERRFEAREPGIDLQLRLKSNDPLYDLDSLGVLLGPGPGGYDIVEVDAVLLGELVTRGLLTRWPTMRTTDWHPAARQAGSIGPTLYGVPHWLCSYFLFTRDARVAASRTSGDLVSALRASPRRTVPALVGDFRGSWTTPGLYLNAWAQTYDPRRAADALGRPLDRTALNGLIDIMHACRTSEDNPCLSKTYDDNEVAPRLFAHDSALAFIGYSERLHVIRREGAGGDVLISAAPLGGGNSMLLYADVLTLRSGTPPSIQDAATKFAAFLTDPATFEFVVMSRDAPGSIPRYLLPASLAAYKRPGLRSDQAYSRLARLIAGTAPFPNSGLYEVRGVMRDSIVAAEQRTH